MSIANRNTTARVLRIAGINLARGGREGRTGVDTGELIRKMQAVGVSQIREGEHLIGIPESVGYGRHLEEGTGLHHDPPTTEGNFTSELRQGSKGWLTREGGGFFKFEKRRGVPKNSAPRREDRPSSAKTFFRSGDRWVGPDEAQKLAKVTILTTHLQGVQARHFLSLAGKEGAKFHPVLVRDALEDALSDLHRLAR